ncbi:Protein mono-ADP-ribosyltransferase PARP6 (ADP-ribosyltransferase diphtheria toxin-like 17) (ARTD17) (Poly [ADP-ribose] polymerase 6) (PARP-6) [Durusdinium trenchii]|uniref:Poly [ADP-ribose] polymerase n=1 Tax=Durusdinium trenchii TaxID=1381693 RepID=A0ABP0IL37_9DINO
MFGSRKQKILEDVEELHAACRSGTLPQVQSSGLNDETLVFEIEGVGSFAACLADPYPSGETEVYGPDDFEFRSPGKILDIISSVILQLAELEEDEASPSGMDWIVTEMPPEASLQHDLLAAKKFLGEAAVTLTQLGTEFWRVRLFVPLQHLHLSNSACSAWGIDAGKPICVELCLPTTGYTFDSVGKSALKRVMQEGFESFALESQLLHILGDFCQLCRDGSWRAWSKDALALDFLSDTNAVDSSRCRYESKKKQLVLTALEDQTAGFLVCLARYLQLRVPTVHEFCAICDKAFQQLPMMMRTVCSEELCTYQFSEFGSKITTAETVNHPSEILDLLMCMLAAAACSARRADILDPYPLVQVGGAGAGAVLHPQQKDFRKLEQLIQELQTMRSTLGRTMGASWALCTSQMSPEAAALLKWTVSSNRSYLENQFQELKKKFGTSFAYHGSSAENWHSILRNGLKNASNTKLMTSGAAHGPGIYLATDSNTSIAYTRARPRNPEPAALKRQRTGHSEPEFRMDRHGGLHSSETKSPNRLDVCFCFWGRWTPVFSDGLESILAVSQSWPVVVLITP